MTKQWFLIGIMFIFCPLGTLNCTAATVQEMRAEAVLFRRFDTVAYTHADLLVDYDIRELDQSKRHVATDLPLSLRLPFVYLVGGLRILGPNALSTLSQSYTAFAVGATDFRPPEGLGMFSSHNCYIGVMNGGPHPNLDSIFSSAKAKFLDGMPVWVWSAPPYEGQPRTTTFYAAQVANSYLLLANDQGVFSDVLSALRSSTDVSISLPGWEAVSAHDYWLYQSLSQIPNSRIRGGDRARAPALTFFADVNKRESSVLVYLTDTTMNNTPDGLPASKLCHYQHVAAGIWQANLRLAQEPTTVSALYQILAAFGFGVVL